MRFCKENRIEAGGIATCVGSLTRARLRYANQQNYDTLVDKGEHFEIVSLVGTVSTSDYHLHLAVANEDGKMFGGHAGPGNRIYTTAEIIIIEGTDWSFRRVPDEKTTFRELSPVRRNAAARSGSR
jgi:predicted DNA-binding protein with PD1-like motif